MFVVVFVPEESLIPFPGPFLLTTRRLAIVTVAALYILSRNKATNDARLDASPLKFLIGLSVFWAIISTANSVEPLVSFKQMVCQVLEYYLLYSILAKTISGAETIDRILKGMVFAVSVACVFGSYEAYTGVSIMSLFPTLQHRFADSGSYMDLARGIRVESTFGNFSLFGTAIAFATIWAIYLLSRVEQPAQKLFLWIGIALMFLNIYKTESRGPWIALTIGFCFLFLFAHSNIRKSMLAISALILLVLIARPGVREAIVNIYAGTFADESDSVLASSYQYRYALIDVGTQALARDPIRKLWGYGLESFYYLDLTGPFNGNPEYHFLSCDNAYVQAMVETGYIGLLILVLLLGAPALLLMKDMWRIPKPHNALCIVLLINMIQYYFMMTNVGLYGWGQTTHMLWACIAMSMAYRSAVRGQRVTLVEWGLAREELVEPPLGSEKLPVQVKAKCNETRIGLKEGL
jgi:O-antigen ligase